MNFSIFCSSLPELISPFKVHLHNHEMLDEFEDLKAGAMISCQVPEQWSKEKNIALLRFELRLKDLKSSVLTTTP